MNLFNAVPTRFEKLPTAFQLMGPQVSSPAGPHDPSCVAIELIINHAIRTWMPDACLPACVRGRIHGVCACARVDAIDVYVCMYVTRRIHEQEADDDIASISQKLGTHVNRRWMTMVSLRSIR